MSCFDEIVNVEVWNQDGEVHTSIPVIAAFDCDEPFYVGIIVNGTFNEKEKLDTQFNCNVLDALEKRGYQLNENAFLTNSMTIDL